MGPEIKCVCVCVKILYLGKQINEVHKSETHLEVELTAKLPLSAIILNVENKI